MVTTVIKQFICCDLSRYIFSSLMKHKTENTHKTHYKAAVRLQWHDSVAQHGRLVVSCILPTQQTSSDLCVVIDMRTGLTITVGL